jgi:sporulation protein YunB
MREVAKIYYFRKNVLISAVLIIVVLFIFAIIFVDAKLKSSILEIARSKAQISGMEAINRVINEKIVSQIEYKDIVYVHKDDEGKIVLVQPNTIKLNQIMASTVIEVTNSLNRMRVDSFYIPLGQLTGSKILSGYGPRIKVKTIPVGQVTVDVLDKFDQAGINQTRHLIYLRVTSKIKVAVPFMDKEVKVISTIPLAETIIVGEVPHTYVNFSGTKEFLNSLAQE